MRARNGQPRRGRLLGLFGVIGHRRQPVAARPPRRRRARHRHPRRPAPRPERGRRRPRREAKTLEIAYLSFAVANSYDAPMLAAAQAAAAAGNAKLTVFDANLDPAAQTKQLRTRSRPASTTGSSPSRSTAPASSRTSRRPSPPASRVGNIDQILGHRLDDRRLPGRRAEANVVFVPSELGRKIGELVVTACADLKATPATSATSGRSRPPPWTGPQGRLRHGDRRPSRDQGRGRRASPSTRRPSA